MKMTDFARVFEPIPLRLNYRLISTIQYIQRLFIHKKITPARLACLCLLYKHTGEGVFDHFPKIFDHFPNISKIFQNCSEGQTNVPEHFSRISENFRRCPRVAEDCRRLSRKTPRSFDDTSTNLSTT